MRYSLAVCKIPLAPFLSETGKLHSSRTGLICWSHPQSLTCVSSSGCEDREDESIARVRCDQQAGLAADLGGQLAVLDDHLGGEVIGVLLDDHGGRLLSRGIALLHQQPLHQLAPVLGRVDDGEHAGVPLPMLVGLDAQFRHVAELTEEVGLVGHVDHVAANAAPCPDRMACDRDGLGEALAPDAGILTVGQDVPLGLEQLGSGHEIICRGGELAVRIARRGLRAQLARGGHDGGGVPLLSGMTILDSQVEHVQADAEGIGHHQGDLRGQLLEAERTGAVEASAVVQLTGLNADTGAVRVLDHPDIADTVDLLERGELLLAEALAEVHVNGIGTRQIADDDGVVGVVVAVAHGVLLSLSELCRWQVCQDKTIMV